MKQIKIIILATILIGFSLSSNSQDTIPQGYVKYTPSFKFKEGLYLNFLQVKENNPVPKSQIVTDINYNSFDFYEKLFESDEISLYDNLGVKKDLKLNEIWGFCDKGVLYINMNEEFNRIPVFGSIGHFIANKTYTEYDPYRYNPYRTYDSYYYDYGSTKTVLMQYLLDFETGKIYDFNYKSVELLLSKDAELYEEFVSLSKRKKKKLKFLYIRKYNNKHPVYLPK
jgi:hypothetical protein